MGLELGLELELELGLELGWQWAGIGKYQPGLHIQSDTYWFSVLRAPSWAFKTPKNTQISRMSLIMGNVRVNLVIITKISDFKA
jgi:hypothetical protein